MAFSEFEIKRIEKVVGEAVEKRRPPVHLRNKLDIGFRIDNQTVFIFERRPDWRDKTQYNEFENVKFTYVKLQKIWKIYWLRQNLKWDDYEPDPTAKSIELALAVVMKDEFGCFWG
ncbi:DUF3024 domain-containing protein [Pseudoalteromonas sp. S16_S37]|uniref:DUF3024 domain-containing protein n=1 Tax=Pseudoalteromonas sp. S16_S37 TaxID=2720228 RepID=UPI001680C458|nr:DUF3024 domain-containing protein [Pseudoalteromonas sp. S16_S37]MBD1583448.1 DUF3024 domain-containing protein [Pseudoalteromonas sp. S16_S37]